MKLQTLLRNSRDGFLNKILLNSLVFSFIFFGVACEDKIPSKSVDDNILHFSEASVSGNKLTTEKVDAKYFIASDANLYVGENDEVKSYALLKFAGMNALPDTIDEVLEAKLTLYMNYTLPYDTLVTDDNWINVYLIKGDGGVSWSDSDWNYDMNEQFDVAVLDKVFLTKYHIGNQDTCEIELPDSIVTFWTDSLNSEGGLLLEGTSDNEERIQKIYSSNNSIKNPIVYSHYIVDGDTVEKYYTPSSDVTIFENKNQADERDCLSISEMYNEAIFVKFDIADLIDDPDSNVYVPEARLKLHVDLNNSKLYDDYLMLNYSLIDTNEYYPEYIYDNQSPNDYMLLGYKDTCSGF